MPEPRVGVAVLILKEDKVLIGKRKGSLGSDCFALPGGHLEFGESWEECAAREVKEETALDIQKIEFTWVDNTVLPEGPRPSHYVTIFMKAILKDPQQEPINVEPDKCEAWLWAAWSDLPQPLFKPLQSLVDSKVDPFVK